MVPFLPCEKCHADCCGPVPLSASKLKAIEDYLHSMPQEDYEALASQKRDPLDCAFLDKRDHRCGIYPVRPSICRIYGTTEGLKCPHADYSLVQLVPDKSAVAIICLEGEAITESNRYVYKREGRNEVTGGNV